jgi:predicted nucleotide-binding protein (sugar kinase/HSP70/actin superfamily)
MALLGYRYYSLWNRFLAELGCTVVCSPATNKEILFAGVAATIDDICIPVKVFIGHLLHLKACGVDAIMVPRMYAIENSASPRFTCPKFMGLPDLARALLDGSPRLLDADVNVRQRPEIMSFVEIGKMLGRGRRASERAYRAATEEQVRFEAGLACGWGFASSVAGASDPAFPSSSLVPSVAPAGDEEELLIATVGHPYLLCDDFLSFSLPKRLAALGVRVMDQHVLTRTELEEELGRYWEVSWSYERELLGAVSRFLSRPEVDGIVFLTSFACGTFAVISEMIEREVRRGNEKPILYLMVDELTGEAGVQTRLESFCDMLRSRKSR